LNAIANHIKNDEILNVIYEKTAEIKMEKYDGELVPILLANYEQLCGNEEHWDIEKHNRDKYEMLDSQKICRDFSN